ncbi:MAG: hypothetical protein AAF563_07215 [Pseudomonadota bacterium]
MEASPSIHVPWLVAVFAVTPIVTAVALQWLSQHSPLTPRLASYSGVVAPFFVSVALLFGLFATFLAAEIWERVNDSSHSLEHEIGAIQTISEIADALGEQGYPIARAVADYTAVVIDEEQNVTSGVRSAAAESALRDLMRSIILLEGAEPENNAAMGALLTSYRDLRQARATRIHIAATHSDPYKWITVIVLGIVTQVALVFCHVDNRKAQSAALAIFTLGFVVTLIALGIHERPLTDPQLTVMSSLYHGGTTNQSP